MSVKIINIVGGWRAVANAARTTIGMNPGEGEPSSEWKRKMLLAEHSPIRLININWIWTDIKYWIHTHFARHKFGVEWFVSTSREDRTGKERGTQDSLIDMQGFANAQALINISRARLCSCAAEETRDEWISMLNTLAQYEPELVDVCVPNCIYRGWCYEIRSCGWHLTKDYQTQLNEYRKNINKWKEVN